MKRCELSSLGRKRGLVGKMRKILEKMYCRIAALLWATLLTTNAVAAMELLEDHDLHEISAQGLFWTDKISGNELVGANSYSTPFTFYRVGLDGELALNTNISKLQLGCGGVNDFVNAKAGCDMDIDYASLMGRSGTSPGNPVSAFKLLRPYLEFAIKGDNTATREIVGMKIGSQSADGAISAGRRYANGQVNQENMLATGCTNATTGSGALGCHSGINSVSGFLGAEMSLSMRARACIRVIFCINLDSWGCVGRTAFTGDNCGTSKNDALFVDIAGTRMQSLGLRAAHLNMQGNDALSSIIANAYASINADLRLVHKLTFENTGDFFISVQREPVAYPRYSKMTPTAEMQANGTYASAMDSCATTSFNTARCNSAYAVPANTGWWLNAPSVKLLDIYNDNANLGELSLGAALSLLAAPGYLIDQADFRLAPTKNCYGATRFC